MAAINWPIHKHSFTWFISEHDEDGSIFSLNQLCMERSHLPYDYQPGTQTNLWINHLIINLLTLFYLTWLIIVDMNTLSNIGFKLWASFECSLLPAQQRLLIYMILSVSWAYSKPITWPNCSCLQYTAWFFNTYMYDIGICVLHT